MRIDSKHEIVQRNYKKEAVRSKEYNKWIKQYTRRNQEQIRWSRESNHDLEDKVVGNTQ